MKNFLLNLDTVVQLLFDHFILELVEITPRIGI